MGRVWAAWDRHLDRRVALKESRGDPDEPASARLRREAWVLGRLDHPAIVPLLDCGQLPDGRPFLVMRLATGRDLGQISLPTTLAERIRLAWRLRDVVAGMAHAHERGVFHRDLKPANIRIEEDGAVQILDWGLARIVDDAVVDDRNPLLGLPRTRMGTRIGTPAYMSPEQASGAEAGPAADVWALSLLLWEALAGRRAYTGRGASEVLAGVLSGPPPSLLRVAPDVPAGWAEVVEAGLLPVQRRLPDAGALLARIDLLLNAAEAPAPRRRPTAIATAVLGTALGAGLGWAFTPQDDAPSAEWVAALVKSGDILEAERVAFERLARYPDDPTARGVFVRSTHPPHALWTAPAPSCTIGEVVRWDGQAVVCASERQTSYWTVSAAGMTQQWERADELHVLAFAGKEDILGVPPRADELVRLATADGAPRVVTTPTLDKGALAESRTNAASAIIMGRRRTRIALPSPDEGTPTPTVRTYASTPYRLTVLEDGVEVMLQDDALSFSDPNGDQEVRRVPIPADHGAPIWYAASGNARAWLVVTSTGQSAVWDDTSQAWSPWTTLPRGAERSVAVSDDGRHAAAIVNGTATLWAVHSPAEPVQVAEMARGLRFTPEGDLFVLGRDTWSMWRMDEPLSAGGHSVDGPLLDLAWSTAGLLALTPTHARFWPTGSEQAIDISNAVGIEAEGNGNRLVVVDEDQQVHIIDENGPAAIHPTPGCRYVGWPANGPLVCASEDSGPHLIDPQTGAINDHPAVPGRRWYKVEITGSHVVLIDWDTNVYTLTGDDLRQQFVLPWITRAVPTHDGSAVLINGRNGLMVRRLDDGDTQMVLPTHARSNRYAVSPNGDWLAIADYERGLQVLDTAQWALRLTSIPSLPRIEALAWSPDSAHLAIGDSAGHVRILDLSAREQSPADLRQSLDPPPSRTNPSGR